MPAVSCSTCGGEQPPESSFADIDLNASAFEIATQLSPCPDASEMRPPATQLAGTTMWIEITGIDETREEQGPTSMSVRVIDMMDASTAETLVHLRPSFIAVGGWALEQAGSHLYAPLDGERTDVPISLTMLISLPGKDVFSAGDCQHESINLGMVELFGDDAADVNRLTSVCTDVRFSDISAHRFRHAV